MRLPRSVSKTPRLRRIVPATPRVGLLLKDMPIFPFMNSTTMDARSVNSPIRPVKFLPSNGRAITIRTWPPLLGAYNDEYLNLLANEKDRRTTSTKIRVRTSNSTLVGENVTIEKSGHMRNSQGRVYLPKLFPPGVSLNDIQ